MTATLTPVDETALGKLTLRVTGPGGKTQTVAFSAACCRIGSSDGCTLRLKAPGVEGLHCVISRGPEETIVRAMAGPLWLNGAQVHESAVAVGDRLRLGSLEVAVIGDERRRQHSERISPAAAGGELADLVAAQTASVSAGLRAIENGVRGKESANHRHAPVPGSRDTSEADITAALESLAGKLTAIDTRLTTLEQALPPRKDELADLRTTLETQAKTWQAKCEELLKSSQQPLIDLTRRLDELTAWTNEARTNEPLSADPAIDERLSSLERLCHQLADQLTRLASEQGANAKAHSARAVMSAENEPVKRPSEGLAFEPVSQAAPLSTIDVLRRMGATLENADGDQSVGPAQADSHSVKQMPPADGASAPFATQEHTVADEAVPALRNVPHPAAAQDQPAAGDDDNEAIDQYMARLLDRVRATSDDGPPERLAEASDHSQRAREQAARKPDSLRAKLISPPASPRAVPPELSADLSAMRALANTTAQTAINTHRQRGQIQSTRIQLLVAAAALVLSFALPWLSPQGSRVALWASLTSLLVSVYWAGRYISLRRKLRSSPAWQQSQHEPDEREAVGDAGAPT